MLLCLEADVSAIGLVSCIRASELWATPSRSHRHFTNAQIWGKEKSMSLQNGSHARSFAQ